MANEHEFEVNISATVVVLAETEDEAERKARKPRNWKHADVEVAENPRFTEYEEELQREEQDGDADE